MTPQKTEKHIQWLRHDDLQKLFVGDDVPTPWLSAYRSTESPEERQTFYSALVPPALISKFVDEGSGGWDIHIGDGMPSVWTSWSEGEETQTYTPFGNEEGIEPLVIYRSFHGIRTPFLELSQEFRFYHNLFPEPSRKRFLKIDDNGDESEAARYGEKFLEVRTDLLLKFCSAKQMALATYVDSSRRSQGTLDDLGLKDARDTYIGARYQYFVSVVSENTLFGENFKTNGSMMGKKYILPGQMPSRKSATPELYQEFVISTEAAGTPIRYTCDPEKLANYFGKNPDAPHYLTPVFFRGEVLAKYYAEPGKYSVEDGYLRCGSLWGLRMDNDHLDAVMVFLGDLGRDLSESERTYWLSFNIAPSGRRMSQTTWKRGFLAQFADPEKPDLVFKHSYNRFNECFREAHHWDFFLPLHDDDRHFLTSLRLLTKDNQAEFDSQLLSLTKVLVDSLNEKDIGKKLTTLVANDKGITKLEKFFAEGGINGYEKHVKFLRVLQDLRSKSAAHRKGSSYEKLVADLQMADEGQQRMFAALLISAADFIRFLELSLIPEKEK